MTAIDVGPGDGPDLVSVNGDNTFESVEGWAHYVDQVLADPYGATGTPS